MLLRVLQIHTRYRDRGGEDTVVDAERKVLEQVANVQLLEFTNAPRSKTLKMLQFLFFFFNPISFYKTIASIRQHKPDIIHLHNWLFAASPSVIWAAKVMRIPIVQTLHNYRYVCANAFLLRNSQICEKCVGSKIGWPAIQHSCYRNSRVQSAMLVLTIALHRFLGTWKRVDKYISLAEFGKMKFVQSGWARAHQIVVKPNFVSQTTEQSGVPQNVIYVGRLSKEKGISLLHNWPSHLPHLKVIGTGPDHEFPSNDNTTFMGTQPFAVVAKELSNALCLVFPSLWYEGFGMVAIEAFAQKVPVVASRIGVIPEIVEDHFNGLLFTPGVKNEMYNAIAELALNHELRRSLSEGAWLTYQQRFTDQANVKRLCSVYESVLTNT